MRLWQVGMLLILLGLTTLVGGCASSGTDSSVQALTEATGIKYLHFRLCVNPNGHIDQNFNGNYAFLLNSQGEAIEVTDVDTFTDIIRFDGINFEWYTRQANLPNPGFTFTLAGGLNSSSYIHSDGTAIEVVVDLTDSTSFLDQYIASDRFTTHAITTDTYNGSILGRVIDTMGSGIDGNSLQTLMVDKFSGAINPLPSYYPDDLLNDWLTRDDLADDFPYTNFDIASFEVFTNDNQ